MEEEEEEKKEEVIMAVAIIVDLLPVGAEVIKTPANSATLSATPTRPLSSIMLLRDMEDTKIVDLVSTIQTNVTKNASVVVEMLVAWDVVWACLVLWFRGIIVLAPSSVLACRCWYLPF